jgi:outer membrane protein
VVKSLMWSAAAALLLATSPAWAQLKIGFVDYSQLMSQSPQAKKVLAQLRADFMPREQALVKLQNELKARASKFQRDAATMTDEQREQTQNDLAARDRDLQRRQQDLQDELTERRNEALQDLQRVLSQAVADYAKSQNFDLVLMGGVIYAKGTMNITPTILARLQAATRSGGGSRRARSGKK